MIKILLRHQISTNLVLRFYRFYRHVTLVTIYALTMMKFHAAPVPTRTYLWSISDTVTPYLGQYLQLSEDMFRKWLKNRNHYKNKSLNILLLQTSECKQLLLPKIYSSCILPEPTSSNDSSHSLPNPGQPKCVIIISTIEGLASAYRINSIFSVKWHSLKTSMVYLKASIWVSLPWFPNSTKYSKDTVAILKTRISAAHHSKGGGGVWLAMFSWNWWDLITKVHGCAFLLDFTFENQGIAEMQWRKLFVWVFTSKSESLFSANQNRVSLRVKICGSKSSIEVQQPTVSGNLKKMFYSCLCTSFMSCYCVLTEKIDKNGSVVTIDHVSRLRVGSLLVSYGDSNVWPGGLLQATVPWACGGCDTKMCRTLIIQRQQQLCPRVMHRQKA